MIVQPPFPFMLPETSWSPPVELPDLVGRGAKFLTVDIESRDQNLMKKGPGFVRGDAAIAGIAVGAENFRKYYPIRHEMGGNLAPNVVLPWVRDQVESLGYDDEIYGANLLYDLEGLWFEAGIREVRAKLRDVQVAEACIDEETAEGYSVDVLSKKYLGEGKDEQVLREAAAGFKKEFKSRRGPGTPFDPKVDLWMMPSQYVGAYAEGDVDRPERIFKKQKKIMESEETWEYFDKVESRLIWILLLMRIRGVRVDLERADQIRKELTIEIDAVSDKIREMVGWHPNIDSPPDLQKVFDQLKIPYPGWTKNKNPSFAQDLLEQVDHEFAQLVLKKRKAMTMRDDFVVGDIMGESHNGRIHCQLHSLRQDTKGTRSSRFSSTNPNLQQVPKRDKVWGPKIRGLFVPDHGQEMIKADYSQQEPRLLVHFASLLKLEGVKVAVEAFRKNPLTDYHQLTTDLVNSESGEEFERDRIKGINLGIMYTMGIDKLCRQLGVERDTGLRILSKYHSALPFVRAIQLKTTDVADKRGNIRTIAGYLRRFNLWEPVPTDDERKRKFKFRGRPRAEAEKQWPGRKLKRFGTHKALNALIQGSAAGQTKRAMVILFYEEKVLAQLQVHDELVNSGDRDAARTMKRTMESAIPLEIPVVADVATGSSWGNAKSPVTC